MKSLRWPIPAVVAWSTSWFLYLLIWLQSGNDLLAWLAGTLWSLFMMRYGSTPMRRLWVALGFPLSQLVAMQAVHWPSWIWPVLLLTVLLIYPQRAWQDAPLFPTPHKALLALPQHVVLPEEALILDAGSGLGDGLVALRNAFPQARLHGLEMSWPLRWLSALRCPWARIRQGNIWNEDWGAYDMVYLFQRPETMPRAIEKAQIDLRRGAWLVSLEFEALHWQAKAVIQDSQGRPVWIYQAPFKPVEPAH